MRLNNKTNIPSDLIREIIRFVRPSGISKFDVEVRNSGNYPFYGRAYHDGCAFHATADPFVVIRIGDEKKFPLILKKEKGTGYLPMEFGNRLECFVAVLAHELRHLWHAKVKKGWRVYGSKGQFSERDADAYALQMLRRFRRQFNYTTMKFDNS